MKSKDTDLIVIEEAVADQIAAAFKPIGEALARAVALKCTAGDWTGAYEACDRFNLIGAISEHEKSFQQTALAAVLFGAGHATSLEESDIATGKVGIPIQVYNSVAQLVHMIEQNAAQVIRDTVRATIRAEEVSEKDQLHHISKDDLYALYERWHDQDRNSLAGMLWAYLDIREQIELDGDPFIMSVRHISREGRPYQLASIDQLRKIPGFVYFLYPDYPDEVGSPWRADGLQLGGSNQGQSPNDLQGPLVSIEAFFHKPFVEAVKAEIDSLYVHRDLINTDDVRAWAKDQGFTSTLPDDDMHVTLCYSKTPVVGAEPLTDNVTVTDGYRKVSQFKDATVLEFGSSEFADRNRDLADMGATSDFPQYHPHVTITYDSPLHISGVTPYTGPLVFGPEVHSPVKSGWADDLEEAILKSIYRDGDPPILENLWQAPRSQPPAKAYQPHAAYADLEDDKATFYGLVTGGNPDAEAALFDAMSGMETKPDYAEAFNAMTNHDFTVVDQLLLRNGVHVEDHFPQGLGLGQYGNIPDDHPLGQLLDHMRVPLSKADTAEEPELTLAEKINQATLGTGKKLFDLAANLTTSRLIAFGFLSQASHSETQYQVNEVLDDKTCPVCQFMHGKVFSVAHEYGKVLSALGTQDPKELADVAPWPDQSKAGIKSLKAMSNVELQTAGYGSPPYHPHCRGFLSIVGTAGAVDDDGNLKEQAQDIIDNLKPSDVEVADDGSVIDATAGAVATVLDVADISDLIDDEEATEETIAANTPHVEEHAAPTDLDTLTAFTQELALGGDVSGEDFVAMAGKGNKAVQDAYQTATNDLNDVADEADAQDAIDAGNWKAVQDILDKEKVDLNEYYTPGADELPTQEDTALSDQTGVHETVDEQIPANVPDNAGDHTPAADFIDSLTPDDDHYPLQQAIYRITNLAQQQEAQTYLDNENWTALAQILDKLKIDPAVYVEKPQN